MSAMFVAALLLQAAPSQADAADGLCAAVMVQLEEQSGKKEKSDLQSALMYFLGKIVGRSGHAAASPALELGAETLAGATDDAALDRVANPCIAELDSILPGE